MKISQTKFDKELEKVLKNEALLTFPDGCKYTGMTKKDPKDNKKLIPHGLGLAVWPDKQSTIALEFADKSLRKDKEIMLVAIKQNSNTLEYVDESLRNDPDILAILN